MKPSHTYLAIGFVALLVVLSFTITPFRELSVGLGWLFIALGIAGVALRLFIRRPASATTPLDPLWTTILHGIGMTLIGIANVWPQYRVTDAGIALMVVTMLPRAIRRYRETNGDSIV